MTSLQTRARQIQRLLDPYRRHPALSTATTAAASPDREGLEPNHFRRAGLLSSPAIQTFLSEHPSEALQVESILSEILRFVAVEEAETLHRDGHEERHLLSMFRSEEPERVPRKWTKNGRYRRFLEANYGEGRIPLSEYDRHAALLRRANKKAPVSCEELKEEILTAWVSALEAKEATSRAELQSARDREILREMERRISDYRRLHDLLGPIRDYLAFSWDLSSSEIHESLFSIVQRSKELLRSQPRIREIAMRLGRLDAAERSLREKRLRSTSSSQHWVASQAAKSAVVGIRESDDLSSITSSEAGLFASEETELLFYLKLAEKKLLTYDYQPEMRSRGRVPDRRVSGRQDYQRGPLVIAVDTSGSMQGEGEETAKSLALALARVALGDGRPVHLISFSRQAESVTIWPTGKGRLDSLIRFLLMSFHGGTELSAALEIGIGMLNRTAFARSDMVFLTDGQAPPFAPSDVAAMNEARRRGVRFCSLLVGDSPNNELLTLFDYNWHYYNDRLDDLAIDLERYRQEAVHPSEGIG